ncbi:HesB/YadR/YfhF family protein [Limosilactobacillus kribbianus]|uniref:HesB/YadR/YfhF family protein n=1 Tax=Limosilactobacillus kribbianus TaxID=2982695 RepID=UPI002264E652|nr:Fe-S cluster assembly protein HesB [Limosilactobacillus kribbianus]
MQLIITAAADQWFRRHLNLQAGAGVRFFGKTTQPHHVRHSSHQGFAREDDLTNSALTVEKNGVNYHINFTDGWFFSGLTTTVDLDQAAQEIVFHFHYEGQDSASPQDVDAITGASSKFEDYWE